MILVNPVVVAVAEPLFAQWTADERWLAGLLWADGHLDANWYIHLNLTDEDALSAAAAIVGRPYRTAPPVPQKNGSPRLPLHRLVFSPGHAAVRQLIAFGFGPNPARAWPEPIASGAFLRGLFDGDGYVGWDFDRRVGKSYLKATMCGGRQLLDGMQVWLAVQGIAPKKVNKNGTGWQVQWSQRDSLRLSEIMYGEPGPFMGRKRARFCRVMRP